MILFLALFSGLLNLSAQVLYQKVVSVTLGDLYATFILVTLTFIAGSALGNLLSSRLRRYLPILEMATGLYNLLLYIVLTGPFYTASLPSVLVVVGLLFPAFTLGTQLPLYSYYLRQTRFSWIYGIYHAGAILGLLAFEIYFTGGNSIRAALLNLGFAQIALGLVLVFSAQGDRFHLQAAPVQQWHLLFAPKNIFSVVSVFIISTISFYQIFWALKTQTFLTEALRLQATEISMAVFAWMSLAGALGKWTAGWPRYLLFFFWSLALLTIQSLFPFVPTLMTDAMSGTLPSYFSWSFILAMFLTMPVLFSSLIFIRGTTDLEATLPVDQAAGYLNVVASVGNILGMVLASLMAGFLWNHAYFSAAIILMTAVLLLSANFEKYYLRGVGCVIVLIIFTVFAFRYEQKDFLLLNRLETLNRTPSDRGETAVYSAAFSSIAVQTLPAQGNRQLERNYYVDGHKSHDLERSTENLVGLIAAKYFPGKVSKSLVIGIGAGQTSWGVASISENVDLVEISPTVKNNLKVFSAENNNLLARDNVQIHLMDGMNFLRECPAGSYDLIVNTSTYPGNFNAAKLFTDELMLLAQKCLKPSGVYQTYFDIASVIDMEQLAEFLAPIQRHFKYVDLVRVPYPVVIAYNEDRALRQADIASLLAPQDQKFYQDTLGIKSVFREQCHELYRKIPELQYGRLNTLDESILESNSIKNMVMTMKPQYIGDYLVDYIKNLNQTGCW